jgi:hypothetical protein
MHIKSLIYKSNQELELDFIPTLAYLFFEANNESVVEKLYNNLKLINPDIEVVGINGHKGNITNYIPFITKYTQVPMLLFDLSRDDFFVDILDIDVKVKEKFLEGMRFFTKSSSIIFPPFRYDINEFLDSVDDNMHNIYGGVYGIDNNIGCFYNGNFYKDKILTTFFNQDVIEFYSIAIHGFKPIGLSFRVTSAKENTIYEINNAPILDVIENYIGKIKQENIDNFLHPFYVYHNGYESLASIKSIDRQKKSVTFYKYIHKGEDIRITIPSNQNGIMKQNIHNTIQN